MTYLFVNNSLAPKQGPSSVIVWLICGTLARGPALRGSDQSMGHHHPVTGYFGNNITLAIHWGTKHTKAWLLLHSLRVAISSFIFTKSTLFYQIFSLSTRCYITP